MSIGSVRKVALVGNHTPRQCGIATFTADLAQAVAETGAEIQVVAMNDRSEGYHYPDTVTYQIDQSNPQSYLEASHFLNAQHLDVLCVQHEFGIFGGPSGSYLLNLLREVNAPVVTTLHTILEHPSHEQRSILAELSQFSERFVVMTNRGKSMLEEVYGIDPAKVSVVSHGIPSIERSSPNRYLGKLGLGGKQVILTFGLISPDKGIEHMISAMPAVVANHPDAHYLIVGATHPNIRKESGEAYRQSLVDLADRLGVTDNIGFVDQFVSLDDLTDYLQAASIYVTPYLKKEQITSGTLAYAFGSGKAVVSTPYWHAEELLADGRGILVPFRDSAALSDEINALLSDPMRLTIIQTLAYEAGLDMRWQAIGCEYVRVFGEAMSASRSMLPTMLPSEDHSEEAATLHIELVLDHLLAITDDTGILQHATYNVPNRFEGYCTDDNARLAIIGARLEDEPKQAATALWLQSKGLSFLHHAFNAETGRMRNFMSYDRRWLEEAGSEDSHGRALWALGVLTDESSVSGIREFAKEIFMKALPAVEGFTSPRSMAFTILGLDKVLASMYSAECLRMLGVLGGRLNDVYLATADQDWRWFERILAYDNARLPQGLMAAGFVLGHDGMIQNAKIALKWLVDVQTDRQGFFLPIGSNGLYPKNGKKAKYDQQPLEAAATIDACYDAFRLTDDPRWRREIGKAFDWFMGANSEMKCMIDEVTGGCMDGLIPGGVNRNQGAESTLSYLASTLVVCQLEHTMARKQHGFLG